MAISNHASISWDHGKEVCLLQHGGLESCSNEIPRSDCTISGPGMFCTSMPTRQARVGITGIMETSISSSRLSWIPLQVLLLYDWRTMMIPSASTIKASDNIPFIKGPLNNYLNIDPNTDFIQMVYQRGPMKSWKKSLPITSAVKGSSFSIIRDLTNKQVSRIYYQDPEWHLRECCYDHLGTMGKWVLGEQVPELRLSMNGYPSHFRWLQPRGAASGDPHNCGNCSRW